MVGSSLILKGLLSTQTSPPLRLLLPGSLENACVLVATVLLRGNPFRSSQLPGAQFSAVSCRALQITFCLWGEKNQKLAPWTCSRSLSWLEFTASFDVYLYITSRCSCQDHVLVEVIYHLPKAYFKQLRTTCRSRKSRDQHRWQEPSQQDPKSLLDILLTNTGLPLNNGVCQGMPPRRCVTSE